MSARAKPSLVLSIWLIVLALSGSSVAERWSRQVSNSDWIPLANPRSQSGPAALTHSQNLPPIPQVHQPLIPGSLPPELRQEYQQQLLQLQKTQESIQRLLLLQQELKAQQQILQSQGFPPNGIPESEDGNQQTLHQGSASNTQPPPEPSSDVLVPPPQLTGEARPPVYTSQNFREPQGETVGQEQYEDYSDRQAEDYRNAERTRESLRDKEKYVPEGPSGPSSTDDGEEEVQVVYVPAEVLAQRQKNQRGRDRKQYNNQDTRQHHHHHQHQHPQQQQQQQQRPFANHHSQSLESTSRDRENVPTTVSPQEDAYAREFLQQLQREHEGTDRLLKEARQKELDRLREERKEIQRQAKLQQAALEREQEIQRQRDAEKKRKELAKLEESAKQRELERIREAREKQRQEELERTKKAQARANEEKRKQEEARQAEIDRLAALERQKKAEIERTIKAQKELERVQKEDEERSREAERTSSHHRESTRHRPSESNESPQAEPLIRSQHSHQQHQTQGKYSRQRSRAKVRQRPHHVNLPNGDSFERDNHETTTPPPSPNQPPLAVYMINPGDTRILRISDVLKTLKDAKTIDVLDNVGPDAPHVFVGPSNLEVTSDYAKFELPYLSSIDNNRVERRVDKLPFFVAPLSFNPPPGYSKIPFPAPHIGSVVVNTLDEHIAPSQPEESYEDVRKPALNPVIEPNSYLESSNQGVSYSTAYEAPTTPSYSRQEEQASTTPQYQSTPSYSSVEANIPGQRFRFRQHFGGEQPSSSSQEQNPSRAAFREQSQRPAFHDQSQSQRPAFHEESALPQSNHPSYSDGSSVSTTPSYRRPNAVTSFTYQDTQQPVSSTPVYQQSYSHVREDSTVRHPNTRPDDQPQHRERYQQAGDPSQEYPSGPVDSGLNYEDPALRGPTQYNLPAELPPIIPQLPGLVNSLLDEGEQAAFVNRQQPTTTVPTTTTTTTTTEAPTTTHRTRGRHRGRVVATRPSTTTTTTPSPRGRDSERTRRPVSRTRSRYTTTTEEYKDTYEPTRSKATETTQRYNAQESYRRPTQRFKSREHETSLQASRNQVHNVQAHEAEAERTPVFESSLRVPETSGLESNEPVYQQYDFASSTTGLENYPVPSGEDRRPTGGSTGEADYSKNLNYQGQGQDATVEGLRNQEEPTRQQQYQEFPASDFRPPLENAPINGFNYETRNEQAKVSPTVPPTSRDFGFYQNGQENFGGSQDAQISTEAPHSQIHEFQRPEIYEQDAGRGPSEDLARPQAQFPINEDKTLNYGANDGATYDPYALDGQDALGGAELAPQQAPLKLTTEATTTTTTTTTEPAPVVIRQRVRGRLGGRSRPDSHVQTRPRGSQDEYVRFSAVNNQKSPTTERPTTRHRENARLRPKARHQYHGSVQVQTEGNDYVRIQAPIRTYQKTIVTPPSTTRRTTTTPAPTTTTVTYEEDPADGLEYGFIRPPNFSPVHPVENRHQNFYRPADNQAQLQSIVPTDETAEDSSLSHTQVSRNRPKYQSPNRRPSIKPVATTTTAASTIAAYTERPRTRVEEPKSNRIRVRGRKPGRRRTTTTTTTTTEYVLEDTNDLPLEENYPRRVEPVLDPIDDRRELYEDRFEAPVPGAAGNPVHLQNNEDISYTGQDFVLNFGGEQASPEPDQTQLASQPPRKYGQAFDSRTRAHAGHRGGLDRDIHGAESQWSTKLTSSSFQPSPSANRLPQEDPKSSGFFESEKHKYANDQVAADAPEIITAAPEDSYVTLLVTSDDKEAKSVDAVPSMEGTNYGMKMRVEGRSDALESSTSTSTSVRDVDAPRSSFGADTSTESVVNGGAENGGDKSTNGLPTRRMGGRRRRVRVRVRPAPTDDFVTAESQHINSAVNSLFQDRLKYNSYFEESKRIPTTTEQPPTPQEYQTTSETPEKTIFEDFLDEMFKGENKSSAESQVSTSSQPEEITATVKSVKDSRQELEETSANKVNAETTTTVVLKTDSSASTYDANSTNAPATSATSVPRKSWDSTKQFIDSIAMQSGEYLPNSRYPENAAFDDSPTGQGNEVLNGVYRQNDDAAEDTRDENYPKNHRSEWSEVRYPTDRGLFKYHRKLNLTAATQLPGVVTKTEGDANVKTLSDYVKAIFDTMKNADEQKIDDLTTTEPSTEEIVGVSSTTNDSTDTEKPTEETPTTVTWNSDSSTLPEVFTGPDKSEQVVKSNDTEETETIEPVKSTEVAEEFSEKTEKPEETSIEARTEKEETTERPENSETVQTTKVAETTTEISTEAITASSSALSSESTTEGTENSSVTDDVSTATPTTTTEDSPMAKVSAKLSGVLRTSTTTKVSHMTEICYRGRCVMTKPKKEFRER